MSDARHVVGSAHEPRLWCHVPPRGDWVLGPNVADVGAKDMSAAGGGKVWRLVVRGCGPVVEVGDSGLRGLTSGPRWSGFGR